MTQLFSGGWIGKKLSKKDGWYFYYIRENEKLVATALFWMRLPMACLVSDDLLNCLRAPPWQKLFSLALLCNSGDTHRPYQTTKGVLKWSTNVLSRYAPKMALLLFFVRTPQNCTRAILLPLSFLLLCMLLQRVWNKKRLYHTTNNILSHVTRLGTLQLLYSFPFRTTVCAPAEF